MRLLGTGGENDEIIDAVYVTPEPEESSWYEFRPSDFALRWTLDEVVSQPLRANEIPRDEIPTLLLESSKRLIDLAAVHSVLAAVMISSPAENLKPAENDDDLIGKAEAAKLLGVDPHWFSGRKLPFKRKLGHRTVKFSRKGLIKWKISHCGS